jgi:hypothetical protein
MSGRRKNKRTKGYMSGHWILTDKRPWNTILLQSLSEIGYSMPFAFGKMIIQHYWDGKVDTQRKAHSIKLRNIRKGSFSDPGSDRFRRRVDEEWLSLKK